MSHPRDVFLREIDEVMILIKRINLCIEEKRDFNLKEVSEYIIEIQEFLENLSKLPLEALHKNDKEEFFLHLRKLKNIFKTLEDLHINEDLKRNKETLLHEIEKETESFWNATSKWGKILNFMYDSP
ncbi:MAG: hypothetical protein N2317_00690 [Syntrophales bacterium]|nr:hypothetical protein [Syntrophales bacterium]